MLNFKIDQLKSNFFDSAKVISALDKATRKALSKFGAFVRTSARSSIRRRNGVSKPGQPPHAHQGDIKKILFAYDAKRQGVVIGPIKQNIVFVNGDGKPTTGTVPQALEKGGSIGIIEVYNDFAKKWYRRDLRYTSGWQTTNPQRKRIVKIAARPFMAPAFQKNLPQLPELWRNQLNRS